MNDCDIKELFGVGAVLFVVIGALVKGSSNEDLFEWRTLSLVVEVVGVSETSSCRFGVVN